MIHEYANGIDDSPVKSIYEAEPIKSVGNGMTFKRNLRGLSDITISVNTLSDTVATRLRKYGLKCSTVQISIKDPDFKTISRQNHYPTPLICKRNCPAGIGAIKGHGGTVEALATNRNNLVPARKK